MVVGSDHSFTFRLHRSLSSNLPLSSLARSPTLRIMLMCDTRKLNSSSSSSKTDEREIRINPSLEYNNIYDSLCGSQERDVDDKEK